MVKFIFLMLFVFIGCSNVSDVNVVNKIKFSKFTVIYNSNYNGIIAGDLHVRTLSDISMFLHEYGHIVHTRYIKPEGKLLELLKTEQKIPPAIKPNYDNRELQDFITTTTRWKVEYPFKHKKDCLIVEELMANLFVIFTMSGKNLEYIKINYREIYNEYGKYYNSLDLKNKKKWNEMVLEDLIKN